MTSKPYRFRWMDLYIFFISEQNKYDPQPALEKQKTLVIIVFSCKCNIYKIK